MAYEMDVLDISLLCTTDLSGKQYRFVKLSADNTVAVCGNGEKALGILQNKPDGSTIPATARVRVFGVSRLEMQATCAYGEYIGSQANGEGLPVSTDHDYFCAICIDGETLATNELCTVLVLGPSTLSA